MRRIPVVLIGILMILGLNLSGCASYKAASKGHDQVIKEALDHPVVETEHGVESRIVLFEHDDVAKAYVGVTPKKCQMLPVLVTMNNQSADIVKLDLTRTYLRLDSGETLASLSLDSAIERAIRNDAEVLGWTLGFGLIGGVIAADHVSRTNRTLEQDYHEKGFKPTLLNQGTQGQGLVFFEYPSDFHDRIQSVVLHLQCLVSQQEFDWEVEIPLASAS